MKFPRFTLKRMMTLVAILGIVFAGAAWLRDLSHLSKNYARSAAYYELRYDANPKNPSVAVQDWEFAMMMKCQRAAMFPWSHVEPDPPEPK